MAENPAITQETIDRIRSQKQDGYEYGIRHWDEYERLVLNRADALLQAAEYGLRAEKFFREIAKTSDLCEGFIDCSSCDIDCSIGEYSVPMDTIRQYGLWPKGE